MEKGEGKRYYILRARCPGQLLKSFLYKNKHSNLNLWVVVSTGNPKPENPQTCIRENQLCNARAREQARAHSHSSDIQVIAVLIDNFIKAVSGETQAVYVFVSVLVHPYISPFICSYIYISSPFLPVPPSCPSLPPFLTHSLTHSLPSSRPLPAQSRPHPFSISISSFACTLAYLTKIRLLK